MTRTDLKLCDLTVKMSYLMSALMKPVTEDNEKSMFLNAMELERLSREYQCRLNELRFGRAK